MSIWVIIGLVIVASLLCGATYWYTGSWKWTVALSACLLFLAGVYLYTGSILYTLIPTVILALIIGAIFYFSSSPKEVVTSPQNVTWGISA